MSVHKIIFMLYNIFSFEYMMTVAYAYAVGPDGTINKAVRNV